MIDERDLEAHESMLNRLEIMRDALEPFAHGRGRMAALAHTLLEVNAEMRLTAEQAWRTAHDPRWQGPEHSRFVGQRHAELALTHAAVLVAYDELCKFGVIPKQMRTEKTTSDLAAEAAAEEKQRKQRGRVAA